MINFCRPLTEIHGSILTTDHQKNLPESVIRAVRMFVGDVGAVRRCPRSTEMSTCS